MPQLGTMSLEIEGLLLLLLLLLAPTIHATATHLANKSCRRERGKKKVETNAWAPKLKAFMPQMTEFAPRGQHFSHITAAWRAEFSCFSPIKKEKKKPVPQLVPHFAMFAQAGDKLLGVRFVTTKALFIIEPFGTHTHIE